MIKLVPKKVLRLPLEHWSTSFDKTPNGAGHSERDRSAGHAELGNRDSVSGKYWRLGLHQQPRDKIFLKYNPWWTCRGGDIWKIPAPRLTWQVSLRTWATYKGAWGRLPKESRWLQKAATADRWTAFMGTCAGRGSPSSSPHPFIFFRLMKS